jgi:hypothetical protein
LEKFAELQEKKLHYYYKNIYTKLEGLPTLLSQIKILQMEKSFFKNLKNVEIQKKIDNSNDFDLDSRLSLSKYDLFYSNTNLKK